MTSALWSHALPDTPVATAFAAGAGLLASCDGTAIVIDPSTAEVVAKRTFDCEALGASLSASGRHALIHGPFGAQLWDIETGQQTPLATQWSAAATWANADRVAVAVGREVLVADRSGRQVWRSEPLPSTVTALAWLGSWRRLAIAAYGGVWIVEPRRGGEARLSAFRGSLLAMAAGPNGRWIVSGNQDATLQVFRSDNDTRLEMQGFPGKITAVAFDSAGRFLANNGASDLTVWDFADPGPRGRAPAMLAAQGYNPDSGEPTSDPPAIAAFAWHPHRPELAVAWADRDVVSYDAAGAVAGMVSAPAAWICGTTADPMTLAWPTAGRIVVGTRDGSVTAYPTAGTR